MSEPVLKKLINIPIWVQNELLIAHFIEVSQRNHFMLFGLLEGICFNFLGLKSRFFMNNIESLL